MMDAAQVLVSFLRETWGAMAGALLAFTLLAMLAQVLKVSSAAVLGANLWVWESVSAVLAVLALGLFGFLCVPQIVQAVQETLPRGGGCGPIGELGAFSAAIIGGLAALRMLKAVFTAIVSASLGGSAVLSGALMEAAEAVFGMLLVAAAVPTAAWFLGAC